MVYFLSIGMVFLQQSMESYPLSFFEISIIIILSINFPENIFCIHQIEKVNPDGDMRSEIYRKNQTTFGDSVFADRGGNNYFKRYLEV